MNDDVVRIHVENFKSLKDFTIDCKKFNVLIGANGSGKTNVLELLKFANLCIDPKRTPAYPFRYWGGFKNIVWSGDVNLPIHFQVSHSIAKYDFDYQVTIDGSSGVPEFLNEELSISNYLHVLRNVQSLKYQFDPKFLDTIRSMLSTTQVVPKHFLRDLAKQSWTEKIGNCISIPRKIQELHVRPIERYSNRRKLMLHISSHNSDSGGYNLGDVGLAVNYSENHDGVFLIPSIRIGDDGNKDFIHEHAAGFLAGERPIILLRQLNYAAIRESPSVESSADLGEDGVGLIGKLFGWYTENQGQLPERFKYALESLFPSWQISFTVTADGRILLNVHDGNTTLSPPSIPDGFYKLLAILTAVELEPKFLLIDEVDTSLHAEIIDYVLAELRTCDSHVIITTHSPLVIDAVKLEDVVILERTESGTTCKRIKNTDSMQKELRDQGLTLSESWIYG